MARTLTLVALSLSLAGCGASAWQIALKALEVAINTAREVHDHHLDGGTICETPVRDAAVVE
jgi:hypothetical protein